MYEDLTYIKTPSNQMVFVGDRVKHFVQRYGYTYGTGTVVGFGESKFIHGPAAVVKVDAFEGIGIDENGNETWCFDRIEKVNIPSDMYEAFLDYCAKLEARREAWQEQKSKVTTAERWDDIGEHAEEHREDADDRSEAEEA